MNAARVAAIGPAFEALLVEFESGAPRADPEHPALVNAREAVRLDAERLAEFQEARERRRREEANRGWRALMLARDLETCQALLAGETVPVSRLDPVWVKRFGRRRP